MDHHSQIHGKKKTDMTYFIQPVEDGDDDSFNMTAEPVKDSKSLENIICVELINNNKIYVKFQEDWTIARVYISSTFS